MTDSLLPVPDFELAKPRNWPVKAVPSIPCISFCNERACCTVGRSVDLAFFESSDFSCSLTISSIALSKSSAISSSVSYALESIWDCIETSVVSLVGPVLRFVRFVEG